MKPTQTQKLLISRAVWQIETRLTLPLSLEMLSDLCAASPYHLSRCFRSQTGLSPMTYLRGRRLSVAAETLAAGETEIMAIALDAQYGSHEAFTRAFSRYFNVLPSTIRADKSTQTLTLMEPLKMEQSLIVDVASPEIKTRDGFRVIGLSANCTFENTSAIPLLWQAFNTREGEVSSTPDAAYGVCCDADDSGHFRYVAGAQAETGADIPSEMDDVSIPAGKYAVFTHSGHISDLPKTVYTIWNKALQDAGFEPAQSPDFERYDGRFDPQTGRGEVEIWIPIA